MDDLAVRGHGVGDVHPIIQAEMMSVAEIPFVAAAEFGAPGQMWPSPTITWNSTSGPNLCRWSMLFWVVIVGVVGFPFNAANRWAVAVMPSQPIVPSGIGPPSTGVTSLVPQN